MSEQIFEQYVDDYGNVSIRVSREFVVFTRDEAEQLRKRFDQLEAENARLREERDCVGMAAYEVGYKNGSVHYELDHCPACKNVADLQEALEENAKLQEQLDTAKHNGVRNAREYARLCHENDRLRELVVEVHEALRSDKAGMFHKLILASMEDDMREMGIEVRG